MFTTATSTLHVAHHFDDAEQQYEAANLGMWLFLATEILFFGGLFAGYTQYRYWYPHEFAFGSHHLDVWLGTINTGGAADQQSHDGARRAGRANQRPRRYRAISHPDDGPWQRVSGREGVRVSSQVRSSTWFPARPSRCRRVTMRQRHIYRRRRDCRGTSRNLLLVLLRDDRPPRAAHGHRHRNSGLAYRRAAAARFPATTSHRSR